MEVKDAKFVQGFMRLTDDAFKKGSHGSDMDIWCNERG